MPESIVYDKSYWEKRYSENQTGWDTGEITTPLKDYFDQLENKHIKILLPGAGNAYEAEYLHLHGFTDVTVIDLAQNPLSNIKQRIPSFPEKNLIAGDFFDLDGKYDLIVEQTFFCALHPGQRQAYAHKMHTLLNTGGKLTGLLFNRTFEGGPPFGGSENEYRGYFSNGFEFKVFAPCYNSIKPRQGSELFINLIKKE